MLRLPRHWLIALALVSACGGNGLTDTSVAPTTTATDPRGDPGTRITLVIPAVISPPNESILECGPGLPPGEWALAVGVELPGFLLPDGTEIGSGLFRLLAGRGDSAGYEIARDAEEDAFGWLAAGGNRESRGVVIQVADRFYAFEAARYLPGDAPGVRVPCRLPSSEGLATAWYSIQAVGSIAGTELFWVWQEEGGPGIRIAPLDG